MGIVTIQKKFKGRWKEKGIKMLMISYAGDRPSETYQMFNPVMKAVSCSRDITWLNWTRPDPECKMSIF
jgi:hypothetical protein